MSNSRSRWDEVVKQSEEVKKNAIILRNQALAIMAIQIIMLVIVTMRRFT